MIKPINYWGRKMLAVAAWTLRQSYSPYQPTGFGKSVTPGDRVALERWQLLEPELCQLAPNSVLDIGSAEGYFVFKIAEATGAITLGLEPDLRRLVLAQLQLIDRPRAGIGFVYGEINQANVLKLPKFDVIILTSLAHHLIVRHGLEETRKLLRHLKERVNKALFFEMGQSNETQHPWAKQLPSMEPDIAGWIITFLKSAGFVKVSILGESAAYGSNQPRYLFKAEPC